MAAQSLHIENLQRQLGALALASSGKDRELDRLYAELDARSGKTPKATLVHVQPGVATSTAAVAKADDKESQGCCSIQ